MEMSKMEMKVDKVDLIWELNFDAGDMYKEDHRKKICLG